MVKIFYYELRRLLGNRFTVGLLLVALLYGYWTMRGEYGTLFPLEFWGLSGRNDAIAPGGSALFSFYSHL